jgi:hypothetical protein
MNHQSYVTAAFIITAIGMGWLLVSSFIAMRKSEALANDLRKQDLSE